MKIYMYIYICTNRPSALFYSLVPSLKQRVHVSNEPPILLAECHFTIAVCL